MPAHHLLPRLVAVAFVTLGLASAQEITVLPGDTLWGLAVRYDTTVDALMNVNGLTSDSLSLGLVLQLPSDPTAAPTIYLVEEGDTLHDIALAFELSVDELIANNQLAGTVIRPGQELLLEALPPTPPEPIVVVVAAGDTLWDIAVAHQVTVDALIAVNLLEGVVIKPGQELRIEVEAAGEPAPLVIEVASGDTLWDLARAFDTTPNAIAAANSLAIDAVVQPGDQLAIPGRYAGPTTDRGGSVPQTIMVTRGETLWEIARTYDTTVAALMAGNRLRSERITVGQELQVVPGRELVRARPSSADPVPAATTALVWPLLGQITSRFGYRQLYSGSSNFHNGIDIDGLTGDAIFAATGGVVTYAAWMGGFGNLVIVTAGETEYYYAHVSELLVYEGEAVEAGQIVARVGSTGRSTGSHLHFEIRVDGTPVDPLPILDSRTSR